MSRTVEFSFVPGVVATNVATSIPVDAPDLDDVTAVTYTVGASGGTASVTSPGNWTPTTGDGAPGAAPGAGNIYYDRQNRQFYLGTATTAGYKLYFRGYVRGSRSKVA